MKARVDSDTGLLAVAFAQPYHPEALEALSTVPVIRLAMISGIKALGGGPHLVTPTSRTMYQLMSQSFPGAFR